MLNSPWNSLAALEANLPADFKQALAAKKARFYQIDANKLAKSVGLGPRINMIMEVVFFKLTKVMDFAQALELLKKDIVTTYALKGQKVVDANIAAVNQAADRLKEVHYPASWAHTKQGAAATNAQLIAEGSAYIRDYFAPITALRGNQLPVSAMDPAGFQPLGSTAYEKRRVAANIPEWNMDRCIQCYQCATVCPTPPSVPLWPMTANWKGAKGVPHEAGHASGTGGQALPHPGVPGGLRGLRQLRRQLPRAGKGPGHEAVGPATEHTAGKSRLRPEEHLAEGRPSRPHHGAHCAAAAIPAAVLRLLRRLRRGPPRKDAYPAVRRTIDHRQRYRLQLHLGRLQPLDALLHQQTRPWPRLGKLAVRRQRRIRVRHHPRLRRASHGVGRAAAGTTGGLLQPAGCRNPPADGAVAGAEERSRCRNTTTYTWPTSVWAPTCSKPSTPSAKQKATTVPPS